MMGSVGSDELLVASQADDGGAGELLRRHGAAGGRRGVGQVPRRHGLEEPLGRRRAGQRGDDVDEAQRPQRGQAPAREGRLCVATASSLRTRPRDSMGNENGTAPRSAESAGRKHARTAMITTPSAIFSGLAPPDVAPLALVPFLGSVQLDTPVRSFT